MSQAPNEAAHVDDETRQRRSAYAMDRAFRRFMVDKTAAELARSVGVSRAEAFCANKVAAARDAYDAAVAAIMRGEFDGIAES